MKSVWTSLQRNLFFEKTLSRQMLHEVGKDDSSKRSREPEVVKDDSLNRT